MSKRICIIASAAILSMALFIAGFYAGRHDTILSARCGRETKDGYTLVFGDIEHDYS